MSFRLTSPDFDDYGRIPRVYACERLGGENVSPALIWLNPPAGTKSYALIVDDEDSPCKKGDFACRHWAVFNIPASITSFRAGEDVSAINGITEGENYTGSIGYAGPCPPNEHTYNFTIFALKDGMPYIPEGAAFTRSQFQKRFSEYILSSATLHGVFAP